MATYAALVVGTLVLAACAGLWLVGERGRFLLPSTREIIRQFPLRRFFSLRGLHFYVYGRWPRQYIGFSTRHVQPRVGRRGKRWIFDNYHGKVLVTEHAKSLISVDREIPLQDLEQILPYAAARNLVLRSPPEVAVLACPCRMSRPKPCLPAEVCMIVGQPFVDFVLEHHPRTSRRVTQAEALEILEAEHRRGHLHAAWFKDACLDRFYAICNCCKCCCGGIEAMVRNGIGMMTSSGYVAQVDPQQCRACGRCQAACPFHAIHVSGKAAVRWEACMGCGVCTGQCRSGAVRLARDERKGPPLDVRLLGGSYATRR